MEKTHIVYVNIANKVSNFLCDPIELNKVIDDLAVTVDLKEEVWAGISSCEVLNDTKTYENHEALVSITMVRIPEEGSLAILSYDNQEEAIQRVLDNTFVHRSRDWCLIHAVDDGHGVAFEYCMQSVLEEIKNFRYKMLRIFVGELDGENTVNIACGKDKSLCIMVFSNEEDMTTYMSNADLMNKWIVS